MEKTTGNSGEDDERGNRTHREDEVVFPVRSSSPSSAIFSGRDVQARSETSRGQTSKGRNVGEQLHRTPMSRVDHLVVHDHLTTAGVLQRSESAHTCMLHGLGGRFLESAGQRCQV